MLMTIGCGLDDSTPRTLADSTAFLAGGTVGQTTYMWMKRIPGNLPDAWRNQGYRSVTLNYWQFSRRFSDFLPFDQNPHPVTSGDPWQTNFAAGSLHANGDRYLTTLPPVSNRHPAALLAALQSDRSGQPLITPKHQYPGDPYTYPLDQNARRLGDLWNQIDLTNWLAVQQGLRLHRISAGSTVVSGLPSPSSKADGMTECWSPFGSTSGRFSGVSAVPERTKNDWEMRYQWTPDANNAPPQVLADILRLAIPVDSSGHSAESVATADRDAYEQSIQSIAAQISTARPYQTNALLQTATSGWSAVPAIQRMAASCVLSGNGTIQPADLGLGAGPRAEFPVLEWDASGTPFVVIDGRHLRRFWSGVSVVDRGDAAYHLRGWVAGSATSGPVLWVKSVAGTSGAEYVDGTPGAWTTNASGSKTRIWLDPASAAAIRTTDTSILVDYPGISLTVGRSHWYRVAIRAELRDLDVPTASTDQSMDLVLHVDPDSSGIAPNTNGMWDSDIPYCDLENKLQWKVADSGGGAIVW